MVTEKFSTHNYQFGNLIDIFIVSIQTDESNSKKDSSGFLV